MARTEMKRVVIIGSGGAGKSTFARRLSEITGLKVLHLDRLYWQGGWVKPPKDEWQRNVEKMLNEDEWIMDGNFGGTMEMRLAVCDTAVFLDLPRIICIYRVFKRWIKYRNTNRPDMTEGCNEKLDLKFLLWIWNFQKTTKPKIVERLQKFQNSKSIIHLKSAKDVENFFINYS